MVMGGAISRSLPFSSSHRLLLWRIFFVFVFTFFSLLFFLGF